MFIVFGMFMMIWMICVGIVLEGRGGNVVDGVVIGEISGLLSTFYLSYLVVIEGLWGGGRGVKMGWETRRDQSSRITNPKSPHQY